MMPHQQMSLLRDRPPHVGRIPAPAMRGWSDRMPASPPNPRTHFWIAGAALLWNLLGLTVFLTQVSMSPEQVVALPAAVRAVHDATPVWLTIAFALAVGGGVLGSIGLLLRQRWAAAAFTVSLVALVVQVAGGYLVTPAWQASGVGGAAMAALLLAIAVAVLSYARRRTA
jgi:hypothetical protein